MRVWVLVGLIRKYLGNVVTKQVPVMNPTGRFGFGARCSNAPSSHLGHSLKATCSALLVGAGAAPVDPRPCDVPHCASGENAALVLHPGGA